VRNGGAMEESRGGEEDQFVEQYMAMILEAEVVKRVGIRKQFFSRYK
jgi:hypothetical protein